MRWLKPSNEVWWGARTGYIATPSYGEPTMLISKTVEELETAQQWVLDTLIGSLILITEQLYKLLGWR